MASGPLRKKTVSSPPCAIINDLPVNIIETILMCLPLRDAVRTSILSRKWRYNWVRIPQLVFDGTFYLGLRKKKKLMTIIYQVLLLHRGPILKFTLSGSWLMRCSDSSEIDHLIIFLSRNGLLEEFSFNFQIRVGDSGVLYKLPSSFFSCLQLRCLSLSGCVFKPPPSFNGFSRLISLNFYRVRFDSDLFGNFISSCPLLEKLTLNSYMIIDYLEIDAPMLKYLWISTGFKFIRFKCTPLLALLSITSVQRGHLEFLDEGKTPQVIEVFGGLPLIEHLCLGNYFLEFLTLGGVPKELPLTINHLKILELQSICLEEINEVSLALCLIKSSPNLEKIMIRVFDNTNAVVDPLELLELLELQHNSDVSFRKLRDVHLWFAFTTRSMLEFIKLLLAKSPVLEKMLIVHDSKDAHQGLMILKELTSFQRVSPKAQILYR